MHQFGCIREATFQRPNYLVDEDHLGTKHPLPDTLITQPHCQQFLITNTTHLRDQFLDHTGKSKEGTSRTNEQAIISRHDILRPSEEAESKLHVLAGSEVDSCCSVFIDHPPTLHHFSTLKGKYLTPFVQARLCTCSGDNITARVGNPRDVQVIVDKLSADAGHAFTKKRRLLVVASVSEQIKSGSRAKDIK